MEVIKLDRKHLNNENPMVFFVMLIVAGILSFLIVYRPFQKQESGAAITNSSFNELTSDQKKEEFSNLTGQEIYNLVKERYLPGPESKDWGKSL